MNEENPFEQQSKRRDAEIDRLDRVLGEKDAEVQRLQNIIRATEVERDAADKVCVNLRAEIERLKAQNKSTVALYESILDRKNTLITELCDALSDNIPSVGSARLLFLLGLEGRNGISSLAPGRPE